MKKLALIIMAGLFTLPATAKEKKYKITRQGSEDGIHYNRVEDTNTSTLRKILCKDPGAITCPVSSINISDNDFPALDVYALLSTIDTEISKGNHSGTGNQGGIWYAYYVNKSSGELVISIADTFDELDLG